MHGTRSHMLQLRVRRPQLKILHATAKTWNSQIKKLKLNIKKKKSYLTETGDTVNLFPVTYCMTFGTGWRDQMKAPERRRWALYKK